MMICLLRSSWFRFGATVLKPHVEEYVEHLRKLTFKSLQLEMRVLGLYSKGSSTQMLLERLQDNADALDTAILQRIKDIKESSILQRSLEGLIKKKPSKDSREKPIPPASIFPYMKPAGESLLPGRRLKQAWLQPVEHNQQWQLFTSTSSAMYPEQYSRDMLQSLLKASGLLDIQKELKMFRARSRLQHVNKSFLPSFARIKKESVEMKQVALQVYTIQRQYRLSEELVMTLPTKFRNPNIRQFTSKVVRSQPRGNFVLGLYTNYSMYKLLAFLVKRNWNFGLAKVIDRVTMFCLLYGKLKEAKADNVQKSLKNFFNKVVSEFEALPQPNTDDDLIERSEILLRLCQAVHDNEQLTESLAKLVVGFHQLLSKSVTEMKFYRFRHNPLKAIKLSLNAICILHNTSVSQELLEYLRHEVLNQTVEHLPRETIIQIVKFFYANKATLTPKETLRLGANATLYQGDMQDMLMCFFLFSRSGVEALPSLLKLAIVLSDLIQQKLLEKDADEKVLTSVIKRVDKTIQDLYAQVQQKE